MSKRRVYIYITPTGMSTRREPSTRPERVRRILRLAQAPGREASHDVGAPFLSPPEHWPARCRCGTCREQLGSAAQR
eukprot:611739-Pyramimonas_sp.AAC.1